MAAYRRDLEGVARRIAADAEVGVVHLEHLTKEALRAAFAFWADDHAAASVLRAHSSLSSFFDFLVAEDLVEGNPMAAVGKPRRETGAPRAIRNPDAAARLLASAAQPDSDNGVGPLLAGLTLSLSGFVPSTGASTAILWRRYHRVRRGRGTGGPGSRA